jgi:hypothetical protein
VARWANRPFPAAQLRSVGVGLVALAVVALAVAAGRAQADDSLQYASLSTPVRELATAAAAGRPPEPVRVDFDGNLNAAGGVHAGLINELDRRGFEVLVDPLFRLQFGDQRVDDGRARSHLLVRADPVAGPAPPGARTLATYDTLTPLERAELDALTARLTAVLEHAGLGDKVALLSSDLAGLVLIGDLPPAVAQEQAAFERLAELRRDGGLRFVLYELRP